MKRAVFAVPGDLNTPTGGYVYDARIIDGLRTRGWQVDVADLGASFPRPDARALHDARNALAKIRPGGVIVIDGLAFGVLPETAPALASRNRLVALVHHPLAFETGLKPDEAARFRESERSALAFAHHVVVTSAATARLLTAHYEVPAEKISVVRPGVDPVKMHAVNKAQAADAPLHLLCVAAITQRKGYDVLIAALGALKALRWRLTIVGEARDPATAARLMLDIAQQDLGDRVTHTGALPATQVAALYGSADVFVLASRFEGYGMAYAEAISHGLPVIGTNAGAIADTLAGAGLMVPPDNVAALTDALRQVIGDGAFRDKLAAGARATKIPTWDDAADEFSRALDAVMAAAPPPKARPSATPGSSPTTPKATP